MDFEDWEPVYEEILRVFGYARAADERTRDSLAGLVTPFDLDRLQALRTGTVAIAAPGPSLGADLDVFSAADATIAASTAGIRLAEMGADITLVVTDLDGDPRGLREVVADGIPVAIHGHGDNGQLVREYVPQFPSHQILATTQAAPVESVRNFGGFTDGDRAAFIADELGADRIVFGGWDLCDSSVSATKRRKLAWAKRLLHWLECRRNEQFDLLDGHRSGLELSHRFRR